MKPVRIVVIAAVCLAVPITAAFASSGTSGPEATPSGAGVKGTFSLQAMMHTATAQFPKLGGVNPWDGRHRGRFGYRSIPCRGNAPVNNLSSNLPSYNTRVAGSREPSSTRLHGFRFSVVKTKKGLRMRGSTSVTVCKLAAGPTADPDPIPDGNKPKIRMTFTSKFKRESGQAVRFIGTFRISSGTQRYSDLRGSGTIAGYLFCLAPEGCVAKGGRYLDGQISLQGTYADPTPQLAAG